MNPRHKHTTRGGHGGRTDDDSARPRHDDHLPMDPELGTFGEAEQGDTSTGAEAAASADSAVIQEEIEQESADLDRAVSELNGLRDRHLRLAAEFDNYRKRSDRERAESGTRAQAQLVGQLLDPLDDLDRVTQLDAGSSREEALLEGVQLVRRKLLRVLEAAGLKAIEAEGEPFDPEKHEALMMVPTEERDEDETVASVFQKGYGFKGILLRPARVQVKRYGG